ncbi:unnamed protein product [Hyaloperonospora brassicae]|uniref:DDE-1 domain-containing protein n=1 Tax=Hyaloperonospora brassicae TaxID=162125 RepID=A0AAV0UAH7_HYABA|nr:unnamed protein product [Hyaloperonospora brassicae]
MERRLNVLKAIEFAAESWNSIGGDIIRSCWDESGVIEAPQLSVTVCVDDYVEIEDRRQIYEEQEALIETEVEPAEVESDKDQAPVSAK